MINTKVTLAGVELKNPVMTASGTFGSGCSLSRGSKTQNDLPSVT